MLLHRAKIIAAALFFAGFSAPPLPAQGGRAGAPPSPSLTLQEAKAKVLDRNPLLASPELEMEAAEARITQAGLRPNPEVSTEIENVAARAPAGLFGLTETTIQLSQLIELGGKRGLRVRSAERERTMAGRALEARRADLMAETSRDFSEVLAAQQRLSVRKELTRLAGQAQTIVAARVAAGKVSPVEETRAEVALATARVEEGKESRALLATKERLAALWGGSPEEFSEVRGRFEIPPDPLGPGAACVEENPAYRKVEAEIESRRAAIDLEESLKKPDLLISGGYRYLNEANQGAWVASVALPIPFSDKRQGAVAEARIRLNQSLADKRAIAWRLQSELAQARRLHETALQEAKGLAQAALPAAQKAAASLEEGYRLGKFDYLDVLDAQRTYAGLQQRYIEAVSSGLLAAIEIERLAGCNSSALSPGSFMEREEIRHEN